MDTLTVKLLTLLRETRGLSASTRAEYVEMVKCEPTLSDIQKEILVAVLEHPKIIMEICCDNLCKAVA